MMKALLTVATRVNGKAYKRVVEPRLLLSDFLRHELGLTGTRVGCEHGVCGACTVLVDGLPMRTICTRCSRRSATPTACSAASARPAS
jgi:aerobic-type carbon monoxide dehydrogenase small subunit (CoxS/CutS family)